MCKIRDVDRLGVTHDMLEHEPESRYPTAICPVGFHGANCRATGGAAGFAAVGNGRPENVGFYNCSCRRPSESLHSAYFSRRRSNTISSEWTRRSASDPRARCVSYRCKHHAAKRNCGEIFGRRPSAPEEPRRRSEWLIFLLRKRGVHQSPPLSHLRSPPEVGRQLGVNHLVLLLGLTSKLLACPHIR